MNIERAQETFAYLVETNEETYNYTKLAEELFELGEVVAKKINKGGTPKEPPIEKFIEEMADVRLRIDVLAAKLGINKKIESYMANKLSTKFYNYMKEEKYKGRV